ncbi:MAG: FAD-dependent oxidoreductase [Sedimentitalea sp.]
MGQIRSADGVHFEVEVPVLIIGAGAAGLTAALSAQRLGAEVLVLERDAAPAGSTALSSGFVPAAGTIFQSDPDSAAVFASDIARKAKGMQDAALTGLATDTIADVINWLGRDHGLDWHVLDGFLYPGHSFHRMHAVPEMTGAGLMMRLQRAVAAAGVQIATQAQVDTLYTQGNEVVGVGLIRPDGARETIGCGALILACNGYGGNPDLVAQHLPDMRDALYFGHAGNQGEAVVWGQGLGAELKHLSGYQGHGSVATPHGVLITWALMMEGGIQVNQDGARFSNELGGYSEQSVHVLNQPAGRAFNIYDQPLHDLGLTFPDYQQAQSAGAVRCAPDIAGLAAKLGIDGAGLAATLAKMTGPDPFGRNFARQLSAPFYGIEVTGALFHTQGGLMIDETGRVMRAQSGVFDTLYACGGAACGVSGPDVSGYLSGNGLLTAFAFGAVAGRHAGKGQR